jgi:hypothetical protein
MSPRTVSNRHSSVKAFLRYCGCDTKELPKPPKYEKTMPEIYTDKELNALFDAVTSPRDSLLYRRENRKQFTHSGLEQDLDAVVWNPALLGQTVYMLQRPTSRLRDDLGVNKFG